MAALFPWPSRPERRAAIAQARRDRIAAERRTRHAQESRKHLERLVAVNHIAEAIAAQIRQKDR